MHPKFILVSKAESPLTGTFYYGIVWQHKDLLRSFQEQFGYAKVHGGGWYKKDDENKTVTLYGSSGDYGEPKLQFLNRIPSELKGYKFFFSLVWGLPGNELDLSGVEWF